MTILDNVDELCKERGISRNALEIQAGLSPRSINKWATTYPGIDKVAKVAYFFEVPISRLLIGTELEIKNAATPEGDGLSGKERELIEAFRFLPDDRQDRLIQQLQVVARGLQVLDSFG